MADETTRLYTVTAAAGLFVAGRLHGGAGSTLSLTAAEARYELVLETIVPKGIPVPVPTPPPSVALSDVIQSMRGPVSQSFTVGEFQAAVFGEALELAAQAIEAAGVVSTVATDLRALAAQVGTDAVAVRAAMDLIDRLVSEIRWAINVTGADLSAVRETKADLDGVLAGKADAVATAQAIASKADLVSTGMSLAAKADAAATNRALGLKADASDVAAKMATMQQTIDTLSGRLAAAFSPDNSGWTTP